MKELPFIIQFTLIDNEEELIALASFRCDPFVGQLPTVVCRAYDAFEIGVRASMTT